MNWLSFWTQQFIMITVVRTSIFIPLKVKCLYYFQPSFINTELHTQQFLFGIGEWKYVILLCYEILFYAEGFFASFGVYTGVISTPANHIPAWASQNVVILNVGILKCSKMYTTSTTHLNMTSLSSQIVYSSHSTYQTFLIVISAHKRMHIFLLIDLNLPCHWS